MTYSMHWLGSLDPRLPKYQAVYKVITAAIASGQLQVGDRLPPQRILAKKLAVTVDTITRAFAELTSHQLISSRVGDGTYVRERNEFAEPEILVDLSQNHPGILYEDALLAATLKEMSRTPERLVDLLDYQDDTGHAPHQLALIKWLRDRGLPDISPGQLTLTSGGQQSLYLTLRTLLRPGDSIMAEQYTYPVLSAMASQMRLHMLAVPLDEEGLIPSELERAQKLTDSRVLYCQPSCHNPTTATLSEERRRELAELARRQDFMIIENITQAMYMEKQPLTLFELAPERTILIGSFSKLTSPGLRVGFAAAESRKGARIAAWLRLCCWMPCLLSAEVIARWIESGEMEKLLAAKNRDLEARHRLVKKHLRDFQYRSNPYSNYLWLSLPETWNSPAMLGALFKEHLIIRGAEAFTVGRTPVPNAMRLSLGTTQTLKDLDRALSTMASIFRANPD